MIYFTLFEIDRFHSVTRLIVIAKTLETTVTELVGEKANNVVNQNHEVVTYLNANFQADKDHITTLKEEIEFLKNVGSLY